MGCGQPVDDSAAQVLAHHVHRAEVEVLDQRVEVLRGGRAREVVLGDGRVAEPAEVHREDAVAAARKGISWRKAHQVSGKPWTSSTGAPSLPADT